MKHPPLALWVWGLLFFWICGWIAYIVILFMETPLEMNRARLSAELLKAIVFLMGPYVIVCASSFMTSPPNVERLRREGRIEQLIRLTRPSWRPLCWFHEPGEMSNSGLQMLAIEALGELGDSRALRALTDRLTREDEQLIIVTAADALARLNDRRAIEYLQAALQQTNDPFVAGKLILALISLHGADAEEMVIAMSRDRRTVIRSSAFEHLVGMAGSGAKARLIEATADHNTEVRHAAIKAMAVHPGWRFADHCLDILQDLLVTGTEDDRQVASQSLATNASYANRRPKVIASLLARLKAGGPSTRLAAANWLAENGDIQDLHFLLEACPDSEVRVQQTLNMAICRLAHQFRDARRQAVEHFIGLLTDLRPDVQNCAVVILKQLKAGNLTSQLGIVFDIDALGGGFYAYKAYKILFQYLDPQRLRGCCFSEGDTRETLEGRARNYCIAISQLDEEQFRYAHASLAACPAPGLQPGQRRFLVAIAVQKEPLVLAAELNAAGILVNRGDRLIDSSWVEGTAWKVM